MKFMTIALYLIITIALYSSDKTPNISTKSAVTFNTLCAKCHEGQCSGRLTFDTGSEAASNHIKRYSDDTNISKKESKEFFTLLNYMKKECLLFMPSETKFNKDNLTLFATASYKRYFFPLGVLKKGNYSLELEAKENIHFKLEVISSQFDSYLDEAFCPESKGKKFDFSIEENINYFLRIQSKKPLHLKSLKINGPL